jgi:HAMP domain-containing protein
VAGLPARLRRGWALRRTIRVRLALWYAALLAATLAAFGGFLYVNLARGLHAQVDRALAAEAQQVNSMLELEKDGRLELEEDGRLLEPGTLVVIYDRAGRLFFTNDHGDALPAMDEALARAAQGGQTYRTVRLAGGAAWRVLVGPAVAEERAVVGALLVAHTLGDVEAMLRSLVTLLVSAVPVLLALAAGGGAFLAGRALDPIDRIVRTAEQIGAADLSRRLGLPPGPDEIGRLAATFDRMLGRLDRAFQRQRQFTADAAHELRTPLAVLIAQADAALAQPRTAAAYRAALVTWNLKPASPTA